MIAFCKNPRKWRLGLERTYEENGKPWLWLMLGPVALNLGSF